MSNSTPAATVGDEPFGSEQDYRLLVESVQDYAIFLVDPQGHVVTWNEGARRIKGYSTAEIVGQHFSIFYTPEDVARGKPELELKNAAASGRFEDEGWRLRKDGTRFWTSVVITALRDPHGRLVGFAKISRDLTERKQAEAALARQADELRRSNAELEQFAYVASHDLQEPLRMVASYAKLLANRYQGRLDADADEFIAYMVDGATRMQQLINSLLTYSRIGSRGQEYAPVSCEAVLDQVLGDLAVSVEESGAGVTRDPLPTIMADATQLTQLFQNLISNSVRFRGQQPPKIHISAARRTGDWLFSVRDNGIGIEPQYFDRIFVIFQRLHTRAEYPGTGIGLAVCKKIVERHGGRIWVESQAGQGSTFFFTLPAASK